MALNPAKMFNKLEGACSHAATSTEQQALGNKHRTTGIEQQALGNKFRAITMNCSVKARGALRRTPPNSSFLYSSALGQRLPGTKPKADPMIIPFAPNLNGIQSSVFSCSALEQSDFQAQSQPLRAQQSRPCDQSLLLRASME
eukprot:1158390-Pelagomonas_calceolata.AAC.7